MTTWIYKATQTKIGDQDTRRLATEFAFLARSLYIEKSGARAARVRKVHLDDVIYFYYRLRDKQRTVDSVGAFRVVDGRKAPGRFAGFAEDTALLKVSEAPGDAAFLALLQKIPTVGEGYAHDPKLGAFTGWALKDLKRTPPDFEQGWLPSPRTTLYPYDDSL